MNPQRHTVCVHDLEKGRRYQFVQFGTHAQVANRVASWNAEHEGHIYTVETEEVLWPSNTMLIRAAVAWAFGVLVAVASVVYILALP